MRILIIKNNIQVDVSDDIQKVESFFKAKTPLDIEIEYLNTNITPQLKSFLKGTDGKDWYGTTGTKDKLLPLIPKDKYDVVLFLYGIDSHEYNGGLITGWNFWDGLYPSTEYVEIPTSPLLDNVGWIWTSIAHEFVHAMCRFAIKKGAGVIDELDVTIKDGLFQKYLHNDNPYHPDGNFTRTLKNLEPYWDLFQNKTSKYKYFKDNEIKGLSEKLVRKLDLAREYAGIPFVITSGLRTVEKNEAVNGVKNSEHLTGEGCDLRCRNSYERWLMVNGALKAGFTRIGIYKSHIHLGVSNPQEVIWISEND